MSIRGLIEALEKALPFRVIQGMLPGADIQSLTSSHRLRFGPTVELRSLYSWSNGSRVNDEYIHPFGFRLMSIAESAAISLELQRVCPNYSFPYEFYPLGDIDGGVVIATLDNVSVNCSRVYTAIPEDGCAYLMHESITAMIKTAITIWNSEGGGVSSDSVAKSYSKDFGAVIDLV